MGKRRCPLSDEIGGSLPAVLVTISVGAILLAPFLAHVSSRMLAMGASDDNARALYAADSGIELAIWTLLNDSGFRNAVDASIGTAVPLTTPLSVNGATTSMQVTALPIGAWTELADTPGARGGGGSLAKHPRSTRSWLDKSLAIQHQHRHLVEPG
jgi:hypothetical protein